MGNFAEKFKFRQSFPAPPVRMHHAAGRFLLLGGHDTTIS